MGREGEGGGGQNGEAATLFYSPDATPLPVLVAACVAAIPLALQPSLPPSSKPSLCFPSGYAISVAHMNPCVMLFGAHSIWLFVSQCPGRRSRVDRKEPFEVILDAISQLPIRVCHFDSTHEP